MIVNDKPNIEDWYIDDEFVKREVDVTKEDKAFIHDLIKRTNFLPGNINYKNY